jgi:hypothetical protein
MSPGIWWQSAMFAWIFWAGLTLGCVALLYLHHSIRAAWSVAFLRFFEAGSRTLIPMGILLLVLLVAGGPYMYPWLEAAYAKNHFVQNRIAWMNLPWVIGRTIVYFVFWVITTEWLTASGRREDRSGDFNESERRASFGAPVGVIHVIVLTTAITDWVMSLDPSWYSTIFGAWFLVCQCLTALSFCTMIMTWSRMNGREPYARLTTKPMMRDWGNMMLGFTMMWAYFSLSQFLIIWSGNLSQETGYYASRLNHDWNGIGTFLVFFSFFAPFLALLYNHTKRSPVTLFWTSAWIFFIRIVDMYWTIIPFFNRTGEHATPFTHLLPSLVTFVVIGAIWLVIFRLIWSRSTPLPLHDQRLAAADPNMIGAVEPTHA